MSVTDSVRNARVLNALRRKLEVLKAAAEDKRATEGVYKQASADALADLLTVEGPNGDGVRFMYQDKEYAAFACKPQSEMIWDAAPLVEWLKENGVFDRVSVTVVDPEKLESEMAAGNIKRSDLDKFQVEKERSAYVKFINPRPESK